MHVCMLCCVHLRVYICGLCTVHAYAQHNVGRQQFVKSKVVEVCDLLHGTQYQVQVRTCYQSSPWSGWSRPRSGHTLEKGTAELLNS